MCERREERERREKERVNTIHVKKNIKKRRNQSYEKKQKYIYEQKIHIWEMLKAQYNLANMYANGQGVRQEFTKAREWWTKAAAQGDEDATKALKR